MISRKELILPPGERLLRFVILTADGGAKSVGELLSIL
jgi:hypothetical protein